MPPDTQLLSPSRRNFLKALGMTAAIGLINACTNDGATATTAAGGTGGTREHRGYRRVRSGELPGDAGVELRVRQPRDDEPVLRPDDVRDRGRRGAARHPDAPVDRLGDAPTSARWSTPSKRRSPAGPTGSPCALVDLEAFNEPDPRGAGRRDPGRVLQRRRAQRPHRPTSARTSTGPASRWVSGSSSSSVRARSALFIATPGQLNIQPRIDGALDAIAESGAAIEATRHRHRRRARGGAQHASRRGTSATPTPPGCSPSTPAARRASARSCRARTPGTTASSAPAATTCCRRRSSWSPKACSTSPSTSSRTCRDSCRCIYLYLCKLSGGVVLPPETNTGLVFLDSASAQLFLGHVEPVRGRLPRSRRSSSPVPG